MKVLNVVQGSDEWIDLRSKYFCASEAPVMMGDSRHMSRNELLRMKSSGDTKEFSDWQQKNLLDRGHEVEKMARDLAETFVGEELYPVTGVFEGRTEGDYLASFDGLTIMENVGFEHKMFNKALFQQVKDKDIPAQYYWQLEHQIMVGGLAYVIFACSDGTDEKFAWMKYEPVKGRRERLLAGWAQFAEDLKNYEHVEIAPKANGTAVAKLPALNIELTGEITASNLVPFQKAALARIEEINTDLKNDQDFADAESNIKFCANAESELADVKKRALAKTVTIDEAFQLIDDLKEKVRQKRLQLEKTVKSRKEAIRHQIRAGAEGKFREHVDSLNVRLGKAYMPSDIPNYLAFADAMKGKKTIASLRDAVDTTLAMNKIVANEVGDKIQNNLNTLRELADEHAFLFTDAPQIVLKENDDLTSLVKLRIHEYEEAERQKRAKENADALAAAKTSTEGEIVAPEPDLSSMGKSGAQATSPAFVSSPNPPSGHDIVMVLAGQYGVPQLVALEWLLNADYTGVRERLA